MRSYLAVNCVQCHQPGGGATGLWDARASTPLNQANIINGTLINNQGDANLHWMVPGDVAHSMVLKRIKGESIQRMPPLATNELDDADIALMTEWIKGMH